MSTNTFHPTLSNYSATIEFLNEENIISDSVASITPNSWYRPRPTPNRPRSITTMDEFAQSREDDDLFADEFEPLSEPATTVDETSEPAVHMQEAIKSAETIANEAPSGHSRTAKREQLQQGQGRQRGGRGGAAGQNGFNSSRYATPNESNTIPTPAAPSFEVVSATPQQSPVTGENIQAPPAQDTAPQPTPIAQASSRILAVRGDRSATGGPLHKKLTEEELTAKLEKMAILNAQKAERHRLSEADQAAFQHREKKLAKERREKRVEEQKNSRQMEMERAKNRQRKMQAQGGREWDSEKVESDIVDGKRVRSSEYVRGGHGGVKRGGLAGSRYAEEGEVAAGEDKAPSRGRGGLEIRGRGRGRRGGRGGKVGLQTVPTAEDFPSLPTLGKNTKAEEKILSLTTENPAGDWAEEMATPNEEKKHVLE